MTTRGGNPNAEDRGGSSLSMPPVRDLTGRVLGDFRVERLLGHGGMGEVYLANQISLDRPVALKVLRSEWARDPVYMARFEAEAWAAAKLNHPNIVHIYTLGGIEDIRFIAMEYVQGTSLGEYLRKKGGPDLPLALAIMRQAGLAIGAAGEAGLIHRDIKPDNLLLTRKGQVKVADFGLARLPDGDRLLQTAPGVAVGTPMYMSPEQVQGHEVDHRSDLYSLGVTFYHMLAGEPPFRAETAVALALKHLRDEPPSLAARRPDLPPELVALVMKLIAKRPEDRHTSASEMLRDLARVKERVQATLAAGAPTLADVPVGAGPSSAPTQQTTSAVDTRQAGLIPPPSWIVAAGIVALLAGAGLGWMARAEDVLSPSVARPMAPALWLADWEAIPKQPTAEAQYRYALTQSTPEDREAAWLAVAGRFPADADRGLASYVQLVRLYLRRGDSARLAILGRSIKDAEAARETARERWLTLAKVCHTGQAALAGDAREVAETFGTMGNLAAMSPAVAELSLEILGRLARSGATMPASLGTARTQWLAALRLPPALLEAAPPPAQ